MLTALETVCSACNSKKSGTNYISSYSHENGRINKFRFVNLLGAGMSVRYHYLSGELVMYWNMNGHFLIWIEVIQAHGAHGGPELKYERNSTVWLGSRGPPQARPKTQWVSTMSPCPWEAKPSAKNLKCSLAGSSSSSCFIDMRKGVSLCGVCRTP